METYFASPLRSAQEEIDQQTQLVMDHPVVSGMLKVIGGMLAVLNEQRQVIALNDELANYLGIDSLSQVCGLRLGEAVACIHADDMPGGCGTGPLCDSCGAAVAVVTSLNEKTVASRKCAIEVIRNGKKTDLFLQIQSVPLEVDSATYLLLFVQDISASQKWAAMEQVFFHDINNILAGVVLISNLLLMESNSENRDMVQQLFRSSKRISQEVAIQRCLLNSEVHSYAPAWGNVSIESVFTELATIFDNHPVVQGKNLIVPEDIPSTIVKTDFSLLLRILNNMLVNAFEATEANGEVVMSYKESGEDVTFSVWNAIEIPKEIRKRLFQRNVSTKGGLGRGIGTYSMKLFGEDVLGGKVEYHSSKESGTLFRLTIDKDRRISVATPHPARLI